MSSEKTMDTGGSPESKSSLHSNEDSIAAASDPSLTEGLALQLLKLAELPSAVFERLHKNAAVLNSRKVRLALLTHPTTPRHISIPMLPHLFTFDLMQVALQPAVAADIKVAAENALIHRLEKLSDGEKLSLARRASGPVAAKLLTDSEARVIRVALDNARLTEASVVKTIAMQDASRDFINAVCHHPMWSLRVEIRMALLRNRHTPEDKAREFANDLRSERLQIVLQDSELPEDIKSRLLQVG
ncbi:MAG: hypothetical protein M3O09_10740 [Acidobacteriota bacterium]|nr:hypothetical protein [Acidobacteriota bacterium]